MDLYIVEKKLHKVQFVGSATSQLCICCALILLCTYLSGYRITCSSYPNFVSFILWFFLFIGSCWAFSTIAATEGITQIKTGKLISLSEQELIDCDIGGGSSGCEGGDMADAFQFIVKNKGINSESGYPYSGTDGKCDTKKEAVHVASITGYEQVPANDEMALLKAVANQPVSVSIDASGNDFQFYSSGVFTGECGTELNHGVTAVGYGVSKDGLKYWLIKNSWGTSWGVGGYLMLQRDVKGKKEGLCGVASESSYPIA